MFPPIFIPDKHTHELRMYVNPMSKKLNFLCFIDFVNVSTKKLGKEGEKQSIMSLSK